MLKKTVELQRSQVNVDSKLWLQAFRVQAECRVEGSGSRWALSALVSRGHHPSVWMGEQKGYWCTATRWDPSWEDSSLGHCLLS